MAHLMPQACTRCWKRKQKVGNIEVTARVCLTDKLFVQCGRELPNCKKCEEVGSVCIQRRMGVVLDPSRPQAFSYVEALKERVHRLQVEANDSARLPLSLEDLSAASPSHSTASLERRDGDNTSDNVAKNDHPDSLQTAPHDMGYLPLSAMAESRDREQMLLQKYSFQTFLIAAASMSDANSHHAAVLNLTPQDEFGAFYRSSMPSSVKLSPEISEKPIQNYLNFCSVSYPFLDRQATLAMSRCVIEELDKGNLEKLTSDAPHDLFLVYMAIATGLLISAKFRYMENIALSLAKHAFGLLPELLKGSNNSCIVRSLIAFAIFSMYSTLGGSTWHLVGLALTRAMSSGMHTGEISDWLSTEPGKLENSRLFWALYVLDTYV